LNILESPLARIPVELGSTKERRQIEERNRREKKAEEDVEKLRYSHEDWNSFRSNFFSIGTETNELLFFKGVIFECTYNDSGKFSQSQMALL